MRLSPESKASIEADIEAEVEERISHYPIMAILDGQEIYIDLRERVDGEIILTFHSPIGVVGEEE